MDFTKWWVTEFKTIKFPSAGTVFDYYIDPESKKFEPWTKRVPKFELDPEVPLQAALVHTAETTRVKFFMDLLLEKKRPVMLVGNAGTGKIRFRKQLRARSHRAKVEANAKKRSKKKQQTSKEIFAFAFPFACCKWALY